MITIEPFKYHGAIQAPYSKSYLQRALAIAGLFEEKIEIIGYTRSKDVVAAGNIARALGSSVSVKGETATIEPTGRRNEQVSINCGEAGLSARMFSPIAAALSKDVEVSGQGSLLDRPMNMVIDALTQLGAKATSNNGMLPIQIKGGINAGEITIDASETSQLLTGLLIALSFVDGTSLINVNNLKSKPYVDMTIEVLHAFGVEIQHENYKVFRVEGVSNRACPITEYGIEGDWSGSSFHAVGAAISGEIVLERLNAESKQADRSILDCLKKVGAIVAVNRDSILIMKDKLKAFEFDATDCPDLFPPLAALAACCNGNSMIKGVNRLQHKESDRAKTIQEELTKLGIHVEIEKDSMIIRGGKVTGGVVLSHNDHRIAMMSAILASVSDGPISIKDEKAVEKSYPDFFLDLPK
jgi:3-phosphoshikimate 1-carboxyvinyltransferase